MKTYNLIKKITSISLLAGLVFGYVPTSVDSATFSGGSVALSSAVPSATGVSYTIDFSNVTLSSIKCIKVVLSDAVTGGSAPAGINTASPTYNAAASDFVPDVQTWTAAQVSSGTIKVTNATGEIPASAAGRTLVISGITNGSTPATSYFAQVSTYDNIDCSTSPVDSGVAAFIYTAGQTVSATVDPSLSFSISAVASGATLKSAADVNVSTTTTTIPFGTVTSATDKIAAHDLVVGTNAGGGYTVAIRETGALTNGSHPITDQSGSNAVPAAFAAGEAFGYTSNDAVLGTGTTGRFGTNDVYAPFTTTAAGNEVAYSAGAVSETVRIGYRLGVSSSTPAGAYSTTVDLIATPTY